MKKLPIAIQILSKKYENICRFTTQELTQFNIQHLQLKITIRDYLNMNFFK